MNDTKKALIFSPYLDQLGGGEVYTLQFAKALEKVGYTINVAWSSKLSNDFQDRFGIDTSTFAVSNKAFKVLTTKGEVWKTYKITSEYDVVFFLSDGSIPFLFGKKNFLHFQAPFTHLENSLVNSIKLRNQTIICNSIFTQNVINQKLSTESVVLYPPIDLKKSAKKEQVILSVGRFTTQLQNKRQDSMIDAFKTLVDSGVKDWKLVLAGNSAEDGSKKLVRKLKKSIGNYPIKIQNDISYKELNQLYANASIYWHAAGLKVDETKNPELTEHFGMTTVEAMSAGALPIVINKGGQKEIVTDSLNGFTFENEDELVSKTLVVINEKQETRNKIQENAKKSAMKFSLERFYEEVGELVRI